MKMCLILLVLAATVLMHEQYHTMKQEVEAEDATRMLSEPPSDVSSTIPVANGMPTSTNNVPFSSKQAEQGGTEGDAIDSLPGSVEIMNPGFRICGNYLVTQDLGKIFSVHLTTGTVRQVYTLEHPWYLVSFDLTADGMIALVLEKSEGCRETAGYKSQTRLVCIDLQALDRPCVLEYVPTYGPDLYQIQTVTFSPNGKYLLVDDRGFHGDRFKIYEVQRSSLTLQLLTEVEGEEYRQLKVIGFDPTSANLYFTRPGEQATLYEYNLAKENWHRLFGDSRSSRYELVAEGDIYSIMSNPNDSKELSIVRITP